jgi:acetyl-CoA C-acetyltransferase
MTGIDDPARGAGTPESRVPVVVATGQSVQRGGGVGVLDLAERAAREALDAVPRLGDRLQRLSFVDALSPTGKAPAGALTRRLGLSPTRVERTTVGGNTPQWLVTRAAADIAAGELETALVVGAEAIASRRAGTTPDAGDEQDLEPDPVVGDERNGVSPQETAVGLGLPIHVYPMLESAIAHRDGRNHERQRAHLGRLLAPFTEVAAAHPQAWFPTARTPDEIARPGPDNRLTAEPYTLRMNAVLAVDQGAAVIVTSLAAARRAGVADRAVFVWAGAEANDAWYVPTRPDLARSPGIAAAAGGALRAAGVGVDDVGRFDLYSCFPVAVELAAQALGIGLDDPRGLTVTGGLPYFGGPGNNYTTHGIATLTDLLREEGGLGLASGLGWFATKHAVGIYGASPPPAGFRRGDTGTAQDAIDAAACELADTHEGPAVVDAATVAYDRDGAVTSAPAYLRLPDGRRLAAAAHPDELAGMAGAQLVGRAVHVEGEVPTYRVSDEPLPHAHAPQEST